jgi:branched-chain amino acid transport system ATP-binding protein
MSLAVSEVSVAYGHVQAVRDVSLTVDRGEIVALLGPNGAGKSSLLRAIAGLQPTKSGQIRWATTRLDGGPASAVARAGVTLVPEGRQVLGTMSVRDNLLLGAYLHHARSLGQLLGPVRWLERRDDMQARLARVYSLFPRLRERLGQRAGSLSGGEQQMLAVGRALMAEPELMLLDEPSVGLAPNLVREILGTLRGLQEQGLTVLLVEQDAHAALRVAQRAYVMESGRIAAEGTPSELLASPQMRNAYLGGI